jgi:hypothetical protein
MHAVFTERYGTPRLWRHRQATCRTASRWPIQRQRLVPDDDDLGCSSCGSGA